MNIKEFITIDDPIIFEIGANTGKDTILFSDLFPDGDIYAFEADPNVFEDLWKNVKDRDNVTALNYAIAKTSGKIIFHPSNQGLSGSIRAPKEHLTVYPQVHFLNDIVVDAVSLDDYMGPYFNGIVDFVWADVQGAELDMIAGGNNFFSNCVKYLYTEFSKKELYDGAPTLDQILQALPDFELVMIDWQWEADGNALLRNKKLC